MRIAYVTVHVAPEIMQGGVGKKIKTQMEIWRKFGHEVNLFSLTPTEIPFPHERQFIFNVKTNLIKREANRVFTLIQMLVAIREYKPDIIYLRFGLYSYPLHRLFRIAPVILEVNSDDQQEYRKRGAFFYWMNRLTRKLTFGFVSGIVSASQELVDILLLKHNKPFCVISNGIDLNGVDIIPAPQNISPVLTLVGSPGMDWHGVDKLIVLADLFRDLEVNIVGYSDDDIGIPLTENVHLLGLLSGEALRNIYCRTDVICGTLALHRKGMNEASPLKVREAISLGIPFILAYTDTDLNEIGLDTILRIPNTEDNVFVNAKLIHRFSYSMMGRRVDVDAMTPYLDQQKKEEMRIDFFKQIVGR